MSASIEKKNRAAAREAGTDKKRNAAIEEEKKRAKTRRAYIISGIAILVFVVVVLFLNSSFMYRHVTALTIGDTDYTAADVNYIYSSEYYTFANNYGAYASLFGLDTTYGITGLNHQECTMIEDGTWRDYFLQSATSELQQLTALNDYAKANSVELTEDEKAEIADEMAEVESSAEEYGYASADKFLSANYGKGVDVSVAEAYATRASLASKAYTAYSDGLEFTDEQIQEEYDSAEGGYDSFNYLYYYIPAETVTTTDSEGNDTTAATDETIADAKATADQIAESYEEQSLLAEPEEALNAAIAEVNADDTCSEGTNVLGSSLSSNYSEWLMDTAREEGEIGVVENASGDGYYVVVFLSRDTNNLSAAEDELRSEAVSEWLTEITDAETVTEGFGYRLVGKN